MLIHFMFINMLSLGWFFNLMVLFFLYVKTIENRFVS